MAWLILGVVCVLGRVAVGISHPSPTSTVAVREVGVEVHPHVLHRNPLLPPDWANLLIHPPRTGAPGKVQIVILGGEVQTEVLVTTLRWSIPVACGTALLTYLLARPSPSDVQSAAIEKAPTLTTVALDLDGTLLNDEHEVSQCSQETLRGLSQEGLGIIIASGRCLAACRQPVLALALPGPLPVVCFNGACGAVFHPGRPEPDILFEDTVPRPLCERLVVLAQATGAFPQYYQGAEVYATPQTEAHHQLLQRYARLTGLRQIVLPTLEGVLALPPYKVLLLSDDPDAVYAAALTAFPAGEVTVVRGSPYFFIEFLPPQVCKGSGLAKLCKLLGKDMSSVVAFGDADNDVEMLRAVGHPVVMKNAAPRIRAGVPHVTEYTNAQDGVARELARLQREGRLALPKAPRPAAAVALYASQGEKEERGEVEPFIESPFSFAKVVSTMVLWAVALGMVGLVLLPGAVALCGVSLVDLPALQKVEYITVLQGLETLTAFAVFTWALAPYRPLPPGWFQYNRQGPLGRRGWLTWAVVGLLLAPLALVVGALANDLLGQTGTSEGVEVVAGLVDQSGAGAQVALVLLSAVTAVLAPLMEEGVFRGFLLPSLTKWTPVPVAVLLSSACFAAVHFSAHDLIPLFLLGNILGLTYVQTKDLLAPTAVHCVWNLLVLALVAAELQVG